MSVADKRTRRQVAAANAAARKSREATSSPEDILPDGLPPFPHDDYTTSVENEQRAQLYRALLQTPEYQQLHADVARNMEWLTRVDDLADLQAIRAFAYLSRFHPVPESARHWFLAGLMKGMDHSMTLPSRWLLRYSAHQEKAAAKNRATPPPDRREGMRIDPIPPAYGPKPEGSS